jgi:ketosteroid isomerase-like protein
LLFLVALALGPWTRRQTCADTGTVSQASIEVIRRAIDAFNRRDLEAIRALHHNDVRMDWSASRGLEAGVYTGLSEVIRFFSTFFDMFDAIRVEAEEFIESGELIVVPNCAHMRGRDGIETIARSTFLFEVRDGRVASLCLYQETSDALRAVDGPRVTRPARSP